VTLKNTNKPLAVWPMLLRLSVIDEKTAFKADLTLADNLASDSNVQDIV
jgi:hypothetical protein